jgi:hypothetical protein
MDNKDRQVFSGLGLLFVFAALIVVWGKTGSPWALGLALTSAAAAVALVLKGFR